MRQNMAGYYPNFSQQGEQKFTSYSQIPFHSSDIPMYSNQGTSAGFFTDVFSGNSLSSQSHVDIPSMGVRNEMTFLPPTGNSMAMQDVGEQLSSPPGNSVGNSVAGDSQVIQRLQLGILNDEQNFQYHGLSLSLGSKIQSSVSIPAYQYQNPSPGFSSLLATHLPVSGIGAMSSTGERNNQNKDSGNSNCLASGTFGTNNSNKTDALLNSHCYGTPKDMHSGPYLYEQSASTNNALSSKYLKAAQQLLDEVVNVRNVLKQPQSKKEENNLDGPNDENLNPESQSKEGHSGPGELNDKSSCELSPAHQQDLESKKLKLLSMIDDVDRRYREYRHQMQIVVSSFERISGFGSAKPYTTLALQTISRHYRCLRDAISWQIKVIQRSLGEQEDSPGSEGGVIPRLRYVDHQLRQQRALQQLGMMRNSWRPQRGLPEHAVSVLRAWLFEHFLHPYPKDSEKIMLARQAGLTRHQVANWFINARVRLWKPMIEEMYKEEFGDPDVNSKSSTEDAPKALKDQSTAEIEGKELQDSMTSATADFIHPKQLVNSRSDKAPNVEINETIGETTFQNYSEVNGERGYRMSKSQNEHRPKTDDQSIYLYDHILPNQIGNSGSMEGSAAYNIAGSGNFTFGNQVSLALGLQHSERDGFSISGGTHFTGNDIAVSSVGADTLDYQGLDLGEQQQNFSNRQMLHDFVV